MNAGEVKQYLSQVKLINLNVSSRQRELDAIRATMTKASTSKLVEDKVNETETQHFDDKYMRLFELDEDINNEIDKLIELQRKIRKQINGLDDPLSIIVLRERYLNDESWESIADSLKQSVRNIHRIHGQALVEFGKSVTQCHSMSQR